jgi:hypothetical protein
MGTTRVSSMRAALHAEGQAEKGGGPTVDDAFKLLMLIVAVYGAYQSAKTALRLAGELFG